MAIIEFVLDASGNRTSIYLDELKKIMTSSGYLVANQITVGHRLHTCDGAACKVIEINGVV